MIKPERTSKLKRGATAEECGTYISVILCKLHLITGGVTYVKKIVSVLLYTRHLF